MFSKLFQLFAAHLKTEIVGWVEQELALYVAAKAAPAAANDAPVSPEPADAGDPGQG